jgi:rubredoxin
MAGQHIEREARYVQTGLSPAERDKYVWEQHHRGVSFQKIGDHLGMSKSACKYIFDRLSGTPRQSVSLDMCEGCWQDFPKSQLDDNLCPDCRGEPADERTTTSPPPGMTASQIYFGS